MVSDSVLFALLTFGASVYVGLWVIEKTVGVYNRCKYRADIKRRIAALGYDPLDPPTTRRRK